MAQTTDQKKKDVPKNRREVGMKRVNIWIADRHYDELEQLAEYDGRTVSDLIRQIIGSFLKDISKTVESR